LAFEDGGHGPPYNIFINRPPPGRRFWNYKIKRRQDRQDNTMKKMPTDPEMLAEYDFSKGIRGKYAERYAQGTNVVVIDPEVAEFFPDQESVNQALRSLAEIIKRQKKVA
jgi:hypothetical protein